MRIIGSRRDSPKVLIKALNDILMERRVDSQYATLLVAFWYPETRRMTIANAGASPPLIWRRGEVHKPRVEGVPIGLLEGRDYEQIELTLEPGDVLLLHSDGVEDQTNAAGEEFTRGRIVRLLKKHASEPPRAIADAVIAALDAYRKNTPISDDQSVIVLRVPEGRAAE